MTEPLNDIVNLSLNSIGSQLEFLELLYRSLLSFNLFILN